MLRIRTVLLAGAVLIIAVIVASPVSAQPLGTFSWQLQPFCNRVTANVTQDGAVYTLDGLDDQCGAVEKATIVGLATLNSDGSISIGLNTVVPGGQPVHIEARITAPSYSGTWRDSVGNTGSFAFGANTGGIARPAPAAAGGDITAVTVSGGLIGGGFSGDVALAIDATVVQRRVGSPCPPGQAIQAIQLNGDVTCVADDHAFNTSNVSVGPQALPATSTGAGNAAVGTRALGDTTTGERNTAIGTDAGAGVTTGSGNTFVGHFARPGSGGLNNATAIGNRAMVDQSDALVLGSVAGVNGATSSARVGIGTTTPDAPLEVIDRPGGAIEATAALTSAGANQSTLMLRHSGGTTASPAAAQSDDVLGRIDFAGHDGVSFTTQGQATIQSNAAENWNTGARGSKLYFGTTPIGSTGTILQRMVIDHDGQVGIGQLIDPQDQLQVVGDIRVGIGSGGCLKDGGGSPIIGSCSSDVRFKRDITAFAPALDRVAALRPVHYFWRADAFPERGFGSDPAAGLIAQEVEQVLPELVSVDDEGYKRVDYGKLPLLAIQAIRELKEKNDALEKRLAAIEAALDPRRR